MPLLQILLSALPDPSSELYLQSVQETLALYNQEYEDLRARTIRSTLTKELLLGYHSSLAPIQKYNESLGILLREQKADLARNLYIWVTINPKPSVTLPSFMKAVLKIVNKTCFKSPLLVFEQRGTKGTEMGKGFHAHFLVQRVLSYKPSKCVQNLRQSCSKLVGNVQSSSQLNIRFLDTAYARDKQNYILGQNKSAEGKDVKQEMDIIWRSAESIDAYYGNKFIF